MFVVIIREKDGTLNVVGPFWHRNAADEFIGTIPTDPTSVKATIESVTDREKFSRTATV